MRKLKETEADIKLTCEEYLKYGQAMGKWIALRLNSGDFILTNPDGSHRRRVKGCPKGTADMVVITNIGGTMMYPIVDFIEFKSEKGRQTKEQKEFEVLVKYQSCGYHVIRSLEDLRAIVEV